MPAVGTCTISQSRVRNQTKVVFDWVSHTDGTVSGTVSGNVTGRILQVITNPGAAAPTDNYDITLIGDEGQDVLNGAGADRDTANTEIAIPSAGLYVSSTLELRIANAGSAKAGRLVLLMGD